MYFSYEMIYYYYIIINKVIRYRRLVDVEEMCLRRERFTIIIKVSCTYVN